MPNHVHFIVWLDPPDTVGMQLNCAPTTTPSIPNAPTTVGQSYTVDPQRPTLGQIVRAFKAAITRRIRKSGADEFVWQRNYYEHIIRNEDELNRIREYIANNPTQWERDDNYPG